MSHSFGQIGSARTEELYNRFLNMSHLEIEISLLQAVHGGATNRALLLSNLRLPWSMLREKVGSLVEAGLLDVEDQDGWVKYRLRPKGLNIIKRYTDVVERVETTIVHSR